MSSTAQGPKDRASQKPDRAEAAKAPKKEPPLKTNLSSAKLEQYSGTRYLAKDVPECKCIMEDSLPLGEVGIVAGPPGVGKGLFCYQFVAHVGAGIGFLNWNIPEPWRAIYITAEESKITVHRRMKAALLQLPSFYRPISARNIHAIPDRRNVSFIHIDPGKNLTPSRYYKNLDHFLHQQTHLPPSDDKLPSLGLVVIDTFARFLPVNEIDNSAITEAIGLVEDLARKYTATVLITHHIAKEKSIFIRTEAELETNLNQQAIRGGSAITGSARWALMLAPLSQSYAIKRFGPEIGDRPNGHFVAGAVVKKNEGRNEDVFFLEHVENGLFGQVFPSNPGQNQEGQKYINVIIHEVAKREKEGGPPLWETSGYDTFNPPIPKRQYINAVRRGKEDGRLDTVKKSGRNMLVIPGGTN